MKRFLLWSFERGSIQYDVICGVILAFIFLTPRSFFDDRPDFMRISGEEVRQTIDDSGNTVFTVKVETPAFSPDEVSREAAVGLLRGSLGADFKISKMQPLYDTTGALVAYSIWIER